jgi:hypothetical protein
VLALLEPPCVAAGAREVHARHAGRTAARRRSGQGYGRRHPHPSV